MNLLQGPYAPPSSMGSQLKQWRVPAGLAVATLLIFLGAQGVKLWELNKAEEQLDAEIAQTFNTILPGQPMVDPRTFELERPHELAARRVRSEVVPQPIRDRLGGDIRRLRARVTGLARYAPVPNAQR